MRSDSVLSTELEGFGRNYLCEITQEIRDESQGLKNIIIIQLCLERLYTHGDIAVYAEDGQKMFHK